ncbi:MAG: hypothetical protein GTO41_18820, partial [Burkholderiales bacterium]|nr:hypothetical protein [Burkholderiales bacterium]
MSVRVAFVLSLVIAASSVQAFGQKQQPRQLGQPQVKLPVSPGTQQQGRIGVQRSASPQSPAQQPAGNPIQPEDLRRVWEGWLQEAGSDQEYPAGNRYPQRRAAPAVPRRTVMSTDQFALLSSGQQSRQLRLALVSLEEDLNRL